MELKNDIIVIMLNLLEVIQAHRAVLMMKEFLCVSLSPYSLD